MKRILLSFSILLLFATASKAQNFKGYAVFGFNGSQVIGDAMTGFNKPGLFGGIKVAFPFTKKLDVSMSINYVQKGSRRTYTKEGDPLGGAISWHLLRTNYIEVPILFHTAIPFFPEQFGAYGGISGARLLNTKFDEDGSGGFVEYPYMRDYDLSFHYGISYFFNENWMLSITNSNSIYSFNSQIFSMFFYRWNRGMFHNVLNFEFAYKF